jgi:hypothetical protein
MQDINTEVRMSWVVERVKMQIVRGALKSSASSTTRKTPAILTGSYWSLLYWR